MHKNNIGKLGEDLACKYLVDKKYQIIQRNFRKPWGEIDIIAKNPDKTLVFVEVKTLRQVKQLGQPIKQLGQPTVDNPATYVAGLVAELSPEENLTSAKYKKLCRVCEFFSRNFPELINKTKGWRIDLITLTLQETSGSTLNKLGGLTIQEKSCIIRHYKNI